MNNSSVLIGPSGAATRITGKPESILQTATLAAWLLFLPRQHPFWSHYLLATVHLRLIPDAPAPLLVYPQAEYEILVMALDPAIRPRVTDMNTLVPLDPPNYCHQFHGFTDEQAVLICRDLAQLFTDGRLLAEPQGIVGARELFADVLNKVKVKAAGHE